MTDISVCVACENRLGEGPLWDVAEQRLYWVDSLRGEIWRCAADGSDVRTWHLPSEIGSLALRVGGGAVLALASGLHLFDFATGALEPIADPSGGADGVRLNDGKVDAQGRFIVGSLDMVAVHEVPERRQPRGTLYRLDPDLTVQELDAGFCVSNGPCWSLDRSTFHFVDSGTGTIFAYAWDEATGTPGGRRLFVQAAPGETPDGSTVDSEGYLWTAFNGAYTGRGELRRFAPDGSLDRVVALPVPKPTSLMFGGPDLDILFVTTMKLATPVPDTPLDGHLFAVRGLGITGLPEPRFAG
ncbi:SMP-30/gluconolactonase/LRE family protein [Sphingomonas jatrophae]|uniref:Sugar lactone lactonase YvrE n=1 Tax=Sphingomonas jatrophae TaxID=1166337 RepID=A0A1I6K8J7_9SPHN|nr:SMP-30/gluconolactonase/LRE family protein [Sphingomonas jatrophae]SFR87561.1 Sugar lactone lactonase YvrE [Sphingomonas jatrophae]